MCYNVYGVMRKLWTTMHKKSCIILHLNRDKWNILLTLVESHGIKITVTRIFQQEFLYVKYNGGIILTGVEYEPAVHVPRTISSTSFKVVLFKAMQLLDHVKPTITFLKLCKIYVKYGKILSLVDYCQTWASFGSVVVGQSWTDLQAVGFLINKND